MIRIKLAVLLAERGMKQADLARETGLSTITISRIIRGDNVNVNFKHIVKICTALDCQVSDIYEYVPVPDPEAYSEAQALNSEITRSIEAILDKHVKWHSRGRGKRAYRDDDL